MSRKKCAHNQVSILENFNLQIHSNLSLYGVKKKPLAFKEYLTPS